MLICWIPLWKNWRKVSSHHYSEDDDNDVIDGMAVYRDTGSYGDYARAVNKHYEELEKELGNEQPRSLLPDLVLLDQQKNTMTKTISNLLLFGHDTVECAHTTCGRLTVAP